MWSFQVSPWAESGVGRVEGRSGGKQDIASTKMIPRPVSEQRGGGRPSSSVAERLGEGKEAGEESQGVLFPWTESLEGSEFSSIKAAIGLNDLGSPSNCLPRGPYGGLTERFS